STPAPPPKSDAGPGWYRVAAGPVVAFALPILAWRLLPRSLASPDADWDFLCGRVAGYAGAVFLLLAYLYALRRFLVRPVYLLQMFPRPGSWSLGSFHCWIFWHICFAF